MNIKVRVLRVIGRHLHLVIDPDDQVIGLFEQRRAWPNSRPVVLRLTDERQRLDGNTFRIGAAGVGAIMLRIAESGRYRSPWAFERRLGAYFPGDPLFREMTRATVRAMLDLEAVGSCSYFKRLARDQLIDSIQSINARHVATEVARCADPMVH